MKKTIFLFFIGISLSFAQNLDFGLEYYTGKTLSSSKFIEFKPAQIIALNIGFKQTDSLNWVKHLNQPTLGVILQYTNHGNAKSIGNSYAVIPAIEIPISPSKIKNLSFQTAIGAAYFTKKYDENSNWENKEVSTNFTWVYRFSLNYNIRVNQLFSTNLSIGYNHFSNGHVKWPNDGLNVVNAGLNIKYNPIPKTNNANNYITKKEKKYFYTTNIGLGVNAISRFYNVSENIYSSGFTIGKIINKTFKFGVGINYRYYQNYYNYIKNDYELVKTDYPELKNNPILNSSSIGVLFNTEFLLNHFGFDTELGFTIFRPFYKADYRLNHLKYNETTQNYDIVGLDSTYKIKRYISTKIGLKYYLIDTYKNPKNNVFVGAHIISNFGQADYSELALGYIHTF
jgi:hypothetical protein